MLGKLMKKLIALKQQRCKHTYIPYGLETDKCIKCGAEKKIEIK